jgi:hypothetical protein
MRWREDSVAQLGAKRVDLFGHLFKIVGFSPDILAAHWLIHKEQRSAAV